MNYLVFKNGLNIMSIYELENTYEAKGKRVYHKEVGRWPINISHGPISTYIRSYNSLTGTIVSLHIETTLEDLKVSLL